MRKHLFCLELSRSNHCEIRSSLSSSQLSQLSDCEIYEPTNGRGTAPDDRSWNVDASRESNPLKGQNQWVTNQCYITLVVLNKAKSQWIKIYACLT